MCLHITIQFSIWKYYLSDYRNIRGKILSSFYGLSQSSVNTMQFNEISIGISITNLEHRHYNTVQFIITSIN